jgi:hypothetical protein
MKQNRFLTRFVGVVLVSVCLSGGTVYAQKKAAKATPLVAVVTDVATYQAVGTEVEGYLAAIREEGKRAVLVIDTWNNPDSIRLRLQTLYETDGLEGAVLVGDVPVVMTRDAQHLSNAFKMDQTRDWHESSIPSDRFYDDFDLKFDFVKRDSVEQLYHYYTLASASAHQVSSDIYSARIKAPVVPGKDKYQLLSEYLKKVVDGKRGKQRELSRVLLFSGHGYNSESLNARLDEEWALKHQFPFLENRRDGRLDFINYDTDLYVRYRLLAMLADPKIDLAILHHHGSEDTQYLGETPRVSVPQQLAETLKSFFRAKLRSAKDTAAAKNYYIENFHVLPEWFDNAFDPATMEADSLADAQLNIEIRDTYGRNFEPGFIMFDACFNGSFHLNDYLSGHYIFAPGGTTVVRANTVNALQDMWPDELIGLLSEGVCVGNWAKEVFTLESHLIGDPTFRYASGSTLDREIVTEASNPTFWRKLLAAGNPTDVRALALIKLQKMKEITSEELLSYLQKDADPVVRLEAFVLLKKRLSPLLVQAIMTAMDDSYELTRRLAVLTAGKAGDAALLEPVTRAFFDPALTTRERFQLQYAIEQYSYNTIEQAFSEARKKSPAWPLEDKYAVFWKNLQRSSDSNREDAVKLNDPTAKRSRFLVATQRNMCQTEHLADYFNFLKNGDDRTLRLMQAETFGWYLYSHKRNEIIDFCKQQYAVEQDAGIKNELEKTINRLSASF